MNQSKLETELRAALHERADQAPQSVASWLPATTARRRPLSRLVAAGVAVASITAVTAVAMTVDGQGPEIFAASPGEGSLVRLGFDSPGFTFQRVQECEPAEATAAPAEPSGRRETVQTFARSYTESPMLFLRTLGPDEVGAFGLLDAEFGEVFAVRGTTGYAAKSRGADRGWNLSVKLPDGRALYAIVVGLDLQGVTAILDGLTPRADGTWEPHALPAGMAELDPSVGSDVCGYSAAGALPGSAGTFEVNVYNDRFDWRLADRASSTVGAVEPVIVDDAPAALGSYRSDDHWVMFEPRPGHTMEIRASGMTRDEVRELVRRARFVDEGTWQAMRP